MTELILLWRAENDIQSAFNRYEEIQEGRGQVFLHQLDIAIGALRLHPELGPVYVESYRRFLIREFPYGIFYQLQKTRIIVAGVFDLRQDPRVIRRKLS